EAGALGTLYWIALRRYQVGLHLAEGKMAEAETISKEALTMLAGASMSRTALAFELRATLGLARIGLGRAAASVAELKQALGGSAPLVGDALRIRGEALLALGHLDEAKTALTASLAIADRAATDRRDRDAIIRALDRTTAAP